jgi:hypothetical protein
MHPLEDGPWIFSRADLTSTAARGLALRAKTHPTHPASPELPNKICSPQQHSEMCVVTSNCQAALGVTRSDASLNHAAAVLACCWPRSSCCARLLQGRHPSVAQTLPPWAMEPGVVHRLLKE